jgi:hypothetical protein
MTLAGLITSTDFSRRETPDGGYGCVEWVACTQVFEALQDIFPTRGMIDRREKRGPFRVREMVGALAVR